MLSHLNKDDLLEICENVDEELLVDALEGKEAGECTAEQLREALLIYDVFMKEIEIYLGVMI